MNLSRIIVTASSALIRPEHREIWREALLADLRDCEELGIKPTQVAVGAARIAVSLQNGRQLSGADTPPGKERPMKLSPHTRTVLLTIIATTWTLGALGLLNIALTHLSVSGSDLGFRLPNSGTELELVPVMIGVAAAAIAAGVASLVLIAARARWSTPAS